MAEEMALSSLVSCCPRSVASAKKLSPGKPQSQPPCSACAKSTDDKHPPPDSPSPSVDTSVVGAGEAEAAPGQVGKQVSQRTMNGLGKPTKARR